jgi:acyl-CoA reductase-like NAD-dependent aldehyde dehydrogenase
MLHPSPHISYNLTHAGMPFGGVKQSGIGYDLGEESVLHEYTVSRAIFSNKMI